MIKFLGILDLTAAIFFALNLFLGRFFPDKLVLILGIIILVKGIIFLIILDYISILDVISAVIILLSLTINIHPIISALVALFLLQKGFFSLIS